MSREDIEVGIDDGFLVVRGERVDENRVDAGWIRQECPTGKCAGACRHPENANDSDITGTYADGVRGLRAPGRESADSSRLVPIN